MKTYLVGGAVRDKLLGENEPKDFDYVVVGSSPEEMAKLGFDKVGASFPVFLCPKTGDEYALARREVKSGSGYNGFDVEFGEDVSLEEDLLRRDLTINAMAMDQYDFTVIDPYGGLDDLKNGVLRHVSSAFEEDPLRVLRVARFAARYGFRVHPTTMDYMKKIVDNGEMEFLTKERVWKEFERAIMENYPALFIEVLEECGAFDVIFPRENAKQTAVVELAKSKRFSNSMDLKTRCCVPGISHCVYSENMATPNDVIKYVKKFEAFKEAVNHYSGYYSLSGNGVMTKLHIAEILSTFCRHDFSVLQSYKKVFNNLNSTYLWLLEKNHHILDIGFDDVPKDEVENTPLNKRGDLLVRYRSRFVI